MHRNRILVVSSDTAKAAKLRSILDEGPLFHTETALDYEAFAERLNMFQPDAVVMDFGSTVCTVEEAVGLKRSADSRIGFILSFRTMAGEQLASYLHLGVDEAVSESESSALPAIALACVERRQGRVQIQERNQILQLSSEVNDAIIESEMLQTMLKRCTDAVVRHVGASFARIWTLNEEGTILELQASSGIYTHLDGQHSRIKVGEFKIGLIAQERKPHLTNSVPEDPRIGDREWARREGMVAFAGYPLILKNELVGVLALFAKRRLTPFVMDALGAIAAHLAIGITRQRAMLDLVEANKKLNARLDLTAAELRRLTGLIPICAGCKKIRDDKGMWNALESYIQRYSAVSFSHGYCPDCLAKTRHELEQIYPGMGEAKL